MAKTKITEAEMKKNAVNEQELFPAIGEENAVATFVPDGIESVSSEEVDEDGFSRSNSEQIGDIIPFHDFKNEPRAVGVLMGEGKIINEGERTETRTYLFRKLNSNVQFLIPQWAMLNDLQKEKPDAWVYRISYLGMQEKNDGSKFHSVRVERRQKGVRE